MNTKLQLAKRIKAFFAKLFPEKKTCKRCGGTYQPAQMHITWVGAIGVTALCQSCFQQIKPEERVPFYKKLRKVWGESGSADEINWPLMLEAILAE